MFDALRAQALHHGVLSVDIETTGKSLDSDVLLIAMCSGANVTTSVSIAVAPTAEAIEFLREMTANPKMKIVGHNILKFDMPVLYRAGLLVKKDVKARVFDTLPLVWLLNENVSHRLKDSVWRYFKHKMVEYEEAYLSSPSLLRKRAADQEAADLRTFIEKKLPSEARKIASEAKRRRLTEIAEDTVLKGEKRTKKSMEEEARVYAATQHSQYVQSKNTQIATRLEELKHEVSKMMLLAQQEQRVYAEDDARQTLRLFRFCSNELNNMGLIKWALCENEVRRISADMEHNGACVDTEIIHDLDTVLIPLIDEFEAEIYNIAKQEFDINSPTQLSEIIYDDLGVEPIGEKRQDKVGKVIDETRSTKENILSRMPHPIGQAVLNYRTATKLKNSFLTKLPKLVALSGDNRIHPSFNTTVRTGRWSCKKPNAQQIPSRKKAASYDDRIQALGPKLRRAFIAPPGMKIIVADLSQIELRLIAHFTDEPMMLEIYNEYTDYDGVRYYIGDIHTRTAQMLKVDRKTAKNINFGLVYGLSAKGFAIRFKIFKPDTKTPDVDATTRFRSEFMDYYGGVPKYLKHLAALRASPLPKCRFTTLSGRFRRFPKTEEVFPGKILNSIIQGSAADILKATFIAMDRHIIQEPEFKDTQLILQVHDEGLLYVREDQAEQVAVLVKYILEAPWFNVDVPILSSVKICNNWSEKDDDNIAEVGVLPPKESGIKPCVAMLSPEQRDWAAKRVVLKNYTYETSEEEDNA